MAYNLGYVGTGYNAGYAGAYAGSTTYPYVLTSHGIADANSIMADANFATTGTVELRIIADFDAAKVVFDWQAFSGQQLWREDVSTLAAVTVISTTDTTDSATIGWKTPDGSEGQFTATVVITAPAVDTTPDAFSFTALTGQALSTTVEFGPMTLTGVTAATDCAVSITGGTYAVSTDDGVTFGGYTASTTQVQLGYQVKVLLETSAENSTATSATLTINGVSATATATTLAAVIDTTPPTITLNGGSTLTLTVGDPFTDPGATATDSFGNPLIVTVTGTANLSEPNTSVLTYTATNADGYSASATLTITVVAPVPQVPQGEFVTLFPETTQTTASISYYYDGSDETGFEYSLNGVDWMTAGNPLTFSGLTASTTYTAQLLAVNAVGPGEAIAINFRTRGEVTLTPDGDWPFFTPTTAAPKTWEWGYRHPKTGVRVRVYK